MRGCAASDLLRRWRSICMSAKKTIEERFRLYRQGATHRRFQTKPFYDSHKHYSDYIDGFHGRPFRRKPIKPPPIAKFFLVLASMFGA